MPSTDFFKIDETKPSGSLHEMAGKEEAVLVVDTEAQRIMRENFGSEKPIPAATMRRSLRIQEAARLYIHHFWEKARCAQFVGCSLASMVSVSKSDGWDDFASLISETLKPSIWAANDIEIPDIGLIQKEKKRRVDGINDLLVEEKRIMESLTGFDVGSKAYSSALAALNAIRKLIDNATGQEYYSQEQSAGRKLLMQKALKENNEKPSMKNAKPSAPTLDV